MKITDKLKATPRALVATFAVNAYRRGRMAEDASRALLTYTGLTPSYIAKLLAGALADREAARVRRNALAREARARLKLQRLQTKEHTK